MYRLVTCSARPILLRRRVPCALAAAFATQATSASAAPPSSAHKTASTTTAVTGSPKPPPTREVRVESDSLDLVMLEGKIAVVLGATGKAGSEAVTQLLAQGAKVVVVVETEEKKKALQEQYPALVKEGRVVPIVGKYESRESVQEILKSVKQVLGSKCNIDHIVSSLGYKSNFSVEKWDDKDLKNVLEQSFFPLMWAADVFTPMLRNQVGSSFTVFDEALPVHVAGTPFWPWAIHDAAVGSLLDILADQNQKTRVNLRRKLRELK